MASENITFRRPDFEDDGQASVSDIAPEEMRHHGHGQPGHPPHTDTNVSPISPTTDKHDFSHARSPLADNVANVEENGLRKSSQADSGDDDTIAMDEREHDKSNGEPKTDARLGSTDKDDLEMAPQQSIAEGESHKVVKKKTYLHRQSISFPEKQKKYPAFVVKTLAVSQNIWTMFSTFPYWDMAFWSGFAYSVGSVMFIIDGAFAFGPLANPDGDWPEGEDKYAGPLLFFFGAVIFYQTGAVMAYLEAVNDGSFAGVAMKRILEGNDADKKKLLDEKLHTFFGHIIPHGHHHHDSTDENDVHRKSTHNSVDEKAQANVDPEAGWRTLSDPEARPGSIYPEDKEPAPARREAVDLGPGEEEGFHEYMTWRWWPTWHAFRTYHIREVGYVATSIQLLGATLYGVTGVVVLPGVLSSLAWWQKIAAFWVPQVVASVCFLTAAIMFTIESQDVWYKPMPWTVRWWIGGWAAIGSMGFLLCACFGLGSHDYTWCEYQSDLSSTWGSAAYLFSALLQWYEAVSAGPVLAFPNNRTPVLMRKAVK